MGEEKDHKKKRTWVEAWILLGLIILFSIGFFLFNQDIIKFYGGDTSDARYLLSALLQGLAAILAIVVTVTLVVLQLAASAYTPRLVSIYIRNLYFWLLLGLYILTISVCAILLSNVSNLSPRVVDYIILLSIFDIAYLAPYIISSSKMLRPSTVIDKLSDKIVYGVKELIEKEDEVREEKDEIIELKEEQVNQLLQPISDIVMGAIMKHDFETARIGIEGIKDSFVELEPDVKDKDVHDAYFAKYYLTHILRYARLALEKNNEELLIKIITNLEEMGLKAVEQKLEPATWNVATALRRVGVAVAEQKLGDVVRDAVTALGKVGVAVAKQKLKGFAATTVTSGGGKNF